jgi:hypothetical protein
MAVSLEQKDICLKFSSFECKRCAASVAPLDHAGEVIFDQAFFEKVCVALFDHAVARGFRSNLF